MATLEGSVLLVNEKVRFAGTAGSKAPIMIDYTPPLGDGEGYTSLQLLLLSLSSCAGTAVLTLLRRMGRTVSAFEVRACGERREEHPTSFSTIDLEFVVQTPDAVDTDVRKAIDLSEASLCPVWAMLKGNVEIRTTIRMLTAVA